MKAHSKNILIAVSILLIMILFFVIERFDLASSWIKPKAIEPFQIKRISGEETTIPQAPQKYILYLWKPDCEECVQINDQFENMLKQSMIKPQQLWTVGVESSKEDLIKILDSKEYTFLLTYDPNPEILEKLEFDQAPTIYFMNEKNEVVRKFRYYNSNIGNKINEFLNSKTK